MYKGSRSRFVPIIIVLVVIAIAVFALVTLGRWVIGSINGGSNAPQTSQQTGAENSLLSTDGSTSVQMTVRGPIVGDEQFRSYQMTISPTSRSIITWAGYDQSNLIDQKTLSNDQKAYDQFVHALNYAGYAKSTTVKDNNTSGLCANGRVYHFDILNGSDAIQDNWTTNCGIKGSFGGNAPDVRALFLDQIDGASDMIDKLDL